MTGAAHTDPALTLEELLGWACESAQKWFAFFEGDPAALALPCGIYKTETVLELVRHIVAVELRYSERLTGLPVTEYDALPKDALAPLIELHNQAVARLRALLADPNQNWDEELEFKTLTAGTLYASRRKILAHALLHGIRHWAQLATLCRAAGHAPGFFGDLIASSALR